MKTKNKNKRPVIDYDLVAVFKEMFDDDPVALQEALTEAQRALSIAKETLDWHEVARDGDFDLF